MAGALRTVLEKRLEEQEISERVKTMQTTESCDQLEYWEDTWRLKGNCCHLDYNEKPLVDICVKNSQWVNSYRPITCLPIRWNILTAQIGVKFYYLLTSHGLFPDEQKGCRKGSRGTAELLNIESTHPKWEQDKTEKSSYDLDWQQKGIWYGLTRLDTTLSQNVQNITWSHKLHWTDHKNLESGADSRRKKHSWNKDPKRHFPRRFTITLTIHNSHDATEPHSQKMRSRIQTQLIARDQPPNVHGLH